jgi:hypothetical protein
MVAVLWADHAPKRSHHKSSSKHRQRSAIAFVSEEEAAPFFESCLAVSYTLDQPPTREKQPLSQSASESQLSDGGVAGASSYLAEGNRFKRSESSLSTNPSQHPPTLSSSSPEPADAALTPDPSRLSAEPQHAPEVVAELRRALAEAQEVNAR